MAHLTTTAVSQTGATVTLVAATSGGDTLDAGDRTFLTVTNGGGSSITVTVASVTVCNQGSTHNLSVSVGAGATKHIGPFPSNRFSDTVSITYSAVTTVTVGAYAA